VIVEIRYAYWVASDEIHWTGSFRLLMLVRHVHRPFATNDSFVACSIEGMVDGGVVVCALRMFEPTLPPSIVLATTDDTQRFIGAVDDTSYTINRAAFILW
jgi:hypothetical protein